MNIFPSPSRNASGATESAKQAAITLLVAVIGVAWILQWWLSLSWLFPVKVAFIFGIGATVVLGLVRKYLESDSLGAANYVTFVRAAITTVVLSLIGETATPELAYLAIACATLTVITDGLDGWLARRYDTMSRFGARFDMETDAILILGIAILVWQFEKTGSWVLASGLMRYFFVAFGHFLPWMNRSLPPSRRRQFVCVLQALLLTVALIPTFDPFIGQVSASVGLLALSVSFVIDLFWLMRQLP